MCDGNKSECGSFKIILDLKYNLAIIEEITDFSFSEGWSWSNKAGIHNTEFTGCPKKKLALGNKLFMTSGCVFWIYIGFLLTWPPSDTLKGYPEFTPQDNPKI